MLHDKLWEIAAGADWFQITVEYGAFAMGAFVVAAALIRGRMRIRKRMQAIESQLSKMQGEIATLLQIQAAVITKLNVNSKTEIDPHDTPVQKGDGDVAGLMVSSPAL